MHPSSTGQCSDPHAARTTYWLRDPGTAITTTFCSPGFTRLSNGPNSTKTRWEWSRMIQATQINKFSLSMSHYHCCKILRMGSISLTGEPMDTSGVWAKEVHQSSSFPVVNALCGKSFLGRGYVGNAHSISHHCMAWRTRCGHSQPASNTRCWTKCSLNRSKKVGGGGTLHRIWKNPPPPRDPVWRSNDSS